jgi:tRNA (cytidine/uridine-2'-O-)-methyltransferase
MFHVVLFEPEIAPNTGNIIRLCANTGAGLHLIEPLGFTLDDKRLKRAGLDYHEWTRLAIHGDLDTCLAEVKPLRVFAFSAKATRSYTEVTYEPGDALLFGPETRGLPPAVLDRLPVGQRLRIPMVGGVRSLNLANAVAVAVYEAWRQVAFVGGR